MSAPAFALIALRENFESPVELARCCGVSRQAAWSWMTGRVQPTPEHAARIEVASDGAIKAQDLRPDIQFIRGIAGEVTGYVVPVKAA